MYKSMTAYLGINGSVILSTLFTFCLGSPNVLELMQDDVSAEYMENPVKMGYADVDELIAAISKEEEPDILKEIAVTTETDITTEVTSAMTEASSIEIVDKIAEEGGAGDVEIVDKVADDVEVTTLKPKTTEVVTQRELPVISTTGVTTATIPIITTTQPTVAMVLTETSPVSVTSIEETTVALETSVAVGEAVAFDDYMSSLFVGLEESTASEQSEVMEIRCKTGKDLYSIYDNCIVGVNTLDCNKNYLKNGVFYCNSLEDIQRTFGDSDLYTAFSKVDFSRYTLIYKVTYNKGFSGKYTVQSPAFDGDTFQVNILAEGTKNKDIDCGYVGCYILIPDKVKYDCDIMFAVDYRE